MLDPNNHVLKAEIADFMDSSLVLQTKWGQTLAEYYYGSNYPLKRTYWNGCSTGGRQGFEMAEYHPGLFDGILAGYPALNWNRFQIGELWSVVALAGIDPADCKGGANGAAGTAEGCQYGSTTAFTSAVTAANAQAVSACDTLGLQGLGNDIVADGVINEPRYCTFDATTLVGQTISPMTSAMTTAQAQAINSIWKGPFNQAGLRLWGGPTYGTSFSTVLSPVSSSLMAGWYTYWMEQNPSADFFGTVTTSSYPTYFQQSTIQYNDTNPTLPGFVTTAATDLVGNLASLPNSTHAWGINGDITNGHTGTKLLHYRGQADQLIVPFNSWNNDTRIFEANGGAAGTQGYYASYLFPGLGHCANNAGFPNAGNFNGNDLFNALINWVENGTTPGSMVAYTGSNDTGNSTLICKYPNQTRYNGSGPTNTASSYSCVPAPNAGATGEDPILSAYDQTAPLYHSAP